MFSKMEQYLQAINRKLDSRNHMKQERQVSSMSDQRKAGNALFLLTVSVLEVSLHYCYFPHCIKLHHIEAPRLFLFTTRFPKTSHVNHHRLLCSGLFASFSCRRHPAVCTLTGLEQAKKNSRRPGLEHQDAPINAAPI